MIRIRSNFKGISTLNSLLVCFIICQTSLFGCFHSCFLNVKLYLVFLLLDRLGDVVILSESDLKNDYCFNSLIKKIKKSINPQKNFTKKLIQKYRMISNYVFIGMKSDENTNQKIENKLIICYNNDTLPI